MRAGFWAVEPPKGTMRARHCRLLIEHYEMYEMAKNAKTKQKKKIFLEG